MTNQRICEMSNIKILDKNHVYEVTNTDGHTKSIISFMKKDEAGNVTPGITNEDVIRVLINRLRGLNNEFPCNENKVAIKGLAVALQALQRRTEDRVKRGVEGKLEK